MRHSASTDERQVSGAAAFIYLLFVAVTALLYVLIAFSATPLEFPLQVLFLTLVVLTLTLKYQTRGLLLLLMLTVMFFSEPAGPFKSSLNVFCIAGLGLLLVLLTARFRSVRAASGQPDLRSLLKIPAAQPLNLHFAKVTQCVGIVFVCLLSAWLLLTIISPDIGAVQAVRLKPNVLRAMTLALTLTAIWLVASLVLNHLNWRKLTRQQAGIYLRSTLLSWNHRDLGLFVRQQLKRRRQASRKRVPQPTPSSDKETTTDVVSA